MQFVAWASKLAVKRSHGLFKVEESHGEERKRQNSSVAETYCH